MENSSFLDKLYSYAKSQGCILSQKEYIKDLYNIDVKVFKLLRPWKTPRSCVNFIKYVNKKWKGK